MSRGPLVARLVLASILLCALPPIVARAQAVPEAALKAAFLYNFAKFAEWPADTAVAGALTMCVLGDAAIADALDRTVNGRTIDGREIVVRRVSAGGFRACHVLYLTGLDAESSRQIVEELKSAPVLTISDRNRFAEDGGIAGLFVEAGKVRFAINVDAAQRARLHISSRLLMLARIVKDEHVQK